MMLSKEYLKISFLCAFIFTCINALIHAHEPMFIMAGIAIIQALNLYLWDKV